MIARTLQVSLSTQKTNMLIVRQPTRLIYTTHLSWTSNAKEQADQMGEIIYKFTLYRVSLFNTVYVVEAEGTMQRAQSILEANGQLLPNHRRK